MNAPATVEPAPAGQMRLARWLRALPVAFLAMPAGWVAYVLANNPTDRIPDPTGPCTFHALFGIDGPSCGITRMTWYLLHGDLIDAARMHLAALIAVPFVGYLWLWWITTWTLGRTMPQLRLNRPLVIGYAAFFLLYSTVLRNLAWAPLHWFYVPNLT